MTMLTVSIIFSSMSSILENILLIGTVLMVLQDRLTVDRKTYPSISLAFSKIYRTEGIRGLYAGLFPTLIGMVPYTTCYFFMYDTMKTSYCRLHKKSSLTRPELLVIGALSGKIQYPLMFTSSTFYLQFYMTQTN